jgi:NAD(P)-dependent dehydrogenase (short-subunit alcohol dehydrogenase family)
MPESFEVQRRFVIVTGGTRGIGRSIATAFLAAGDTVLVCGRSAPDTLPAHDNNVAHFENADLRDAAQAEKLIKTFVAKHGRIDVLVNNAGGSPPLDAATAPAKLSEKILALNLLAPLHCAQAANAVMQTQDTGGLIINIASVSGARPSPGTAIYGAAKAGLLSLTQSLAMEWAPKVRVNAIIVGLVLTEAGEEHYGGVEGAKRVAQTIPMKRFVAPQDVANGCLLLASPLATHITGAKLEVHGGGEPPVFLTAIQS